MIHLLPITFALSLIGVNENAELATRSKQPTPPNTICVSENFYVDRTEVSNLFWYEYTSYLSTVFGNDSEQLKAALPDTAAWLAKRDGYYKPFAQHYFQHQAYREYPVVSITQDQALLYCKWRSDRAFEILLIKAGIIEHNSNQVFTTEKFFGEEIPRISDKKLDYYPVFDLPTVEEWNAFYSYNAELRAKSKSRKSSESTFPIADEGTMSLSPVSNSEIRRSKNLILQLEGNVSEWLKNSNTAAGGNWYTGQSSRFTTQESADAATGFRCVARWVKWKE
jgi:hypothetical protein